MKSLKRKSDKFNSRVTRQRPFISADYNFLISYKNYLLVCYLDAKLIKLELLLKIWRCSNEEEREKVREAWVVWEGRDYWRLGYTLCPRSGLASVQQVVLSSPLLSSSTSGPSSSPSYTTHYTPDRFSSSHLICCKFLFLKFRRHIFFKNICVVFAKWMQKVFGYIFLDLKKVKINSTLLLSTLNCRNSTSRTM